ncbi:hypothetical protein BC835DRAFT_664779 [Cytidiella melzeri]|nr:hypothetical protein BC835DRAFT_664779 [Cytidiella melzeri]
MTDVLAFNMFAHSRVPYHGQALASLPPTSPKLATTGGGPLYYRQHEVIQLIEVPAPTQQQHLSDITSSSVASSSYSDSDSSAADSDESESCSSYCSSDEEAFEGSSHGCYDDTYNTRLSRVAAWRDSFAKAMGVAFNSAHSKSLTQRPIRSHCCSACDSDFATPQSLREHAQHSKLGEACRTAVEYGLEP